MRGEAESGEPGEPSEEGKPVTSINQPEGWIRWGVGSPFSNSTEGSHSWQHCVAMGNGVT